MIAYQVFDTEQMTFVSGIYETFADAYTFAAQTNGLVVVAVGDEQIAAAKAEKTKADKLAKYAAVQAAQEARARAEAREANLQAAKVAEAEAAADAAKAAQDAANAAASEAGIDLPFPAPTEEGEAAA